MQKTKTTININEDLWKKFSHLVIEERGYRKKNEVIEKLIRDYVDERMQKNGSHIKKAVILAAGTGSRLRPLTEEIPKCLVKINSHTILERQIENLKKCGIQNITIIGGHQAKKIKDWCKENKLKCAVIEDKNYPEHNNLFSLWLARKNMEGGFVCLNSDVVFESSILETLLRQRRDICLVVDKKECTEEDMKVKVRNDLLTAINKRIPKEEVYGEFIGVSMFSGEGARQLDSILSNLSENVRKKAYVAAAIQKLVDSNYPVHIYEIQNKFWADIDFVEDLNEVRDYFISKRGV